MKMLRAVALAAVLGGLVVADVSAQSPVIGFRLGASMSKPDIEPDDETDELEYLTKLTGGGFIRFGFGGFGIQPELMFVSKGFKVEEAAGDASLKFDYVEIPVLLHLSFGAGSLAPYVVAGPAFAFEIGCELEFDGDGASGSVDCDDEAAEGEFERKKFDVGAMFGAGLAFPAGPGSIILDGRYNFGLMNIADDDTDPDAEFKHRTIYITAGYQIPLGMR